MPYFIDDSLSEKELESFLMNLGIVYLGMLLIAFVFAYFLSNYITQSLTRISEKIKTTKLINKVIVPIDKFAFNEIP